MDGGGRNGEGDRELHELVSYARSVRTILEKSESVTRSLVSSLAHLGDDLNACQRRIKNVLNEIEPKRARMRNMQLTSVELAVLYKLLAEIDHDKLQIMQGTRGLVDQYIEALEQLSAIERYDYLKQSDSQVMQAYYE